ncbi:rho GTPase-activating protein 18 isoform X2 [Strongylocentrotus purpuratus]|uniref:Rho-GAP domain-containing protein n=1 Tax=Strongylocentrotus purpuratus TaxID=7668 RepID=A0A7M7N588_STRPU|nr:rho GTPase-activating protein 18 isoform X2 [Strongylocentrotus purpuratus]|eukprot:XP_011670293.1 PREDICTED: rho GTPase-activating protein 18 isoform X2 [Strongylocentrotus purpuratus]
MNSPERSEPGSGELSTYFSELEEIKRTSTIITTEITNGDSSSLERSFERLESRESCTSEGEAEVLWLHEIGLENLAVASKKGRGLDNELWENATSTLTKSQAAAVRKRVDRVNETYKQRLLAARDAKTRKPDVRDIFPPQDPRTERSSVSSADGYPTGRKGSKRRKSRTLPDPRHADRESIVKNHKEMSSGVADLDTGVKILSFTHTEPIEVPSCKEHEVKVSMRAQTPDSTLDLHGGDEVFLRQEDLFKNLATTLPNITIAKDAQGTTPVEFLSGKDVDKVRKIALIELTAMFDRMGIEFEPVRKSTKRRVKENGVFGVPLRNLIAHDRMWSPETTTPLFLQKLIGYLEVHGLHEEGVLRVPGSSARIKQLREEIERDFYDGKFSFDDLRINDAVGLLKQFLREMPTPILTFEYVNAFAMVEKIKDRKKQLQCLNLLVLVLPDTHRATLKLLLSYLSRIVSCESQNKMSLNNVAMIMAPNLFSGRAISRKKSPDYSELHIAAGTSNIMRMLVKYHNILWVVPFRMLEQVRKMYEVDMKRSRDSKSEVAEGIIRIQTPGSVEKVLTTIQLSERTTAGDIVAKFTEDTPFMSIEPAPLKRNSLRRRSRKKSIQRNSSFDMCSNITSSRAPKFYLYEVGGCIGERCLDPETNMMALVRVNPTAEWIIRCRPT